MSETQPPNKKACGADDRLPDRNPLHSDSLTLQDIVHGLAVVSIFPSFGSESRSRCVVVGAPFMSSDRYPDSELPNRWMVTVDTSDPNSGNGVRHEDRYLSTMGVVPLEGRIGQSRVWANWVYSLADTD